MSAIVGIYYPNGRSVKSEQLTNMTDILAHRGSDNVDIWCEENVGLGHRMLYTTPESLHEQLPLVDSTADYVITADARIDNREELIALLDFGDTASEKIADSQIILAAYKKWGDECCDKLLGDFAFAIWDKPQQQLFCARDHFGVKPFYYYLSKSIFAFATEAKGILCLPEIPRKLNEVKVGDYLTSMFEDKAITFYQDIFRLPPAHSLILTAERTELKCYWSLDPNQELILDSDEEYAVRFREIFTEAVRCRLRSHTQTGTMLSGGLDSSSITCTARKIMNEQDIDAKLPTFSAIFDEVKECDESFYINSVLSQGGYEPNYLHGDKRSPLADIDKITWHLDEPLHAFNLFLNTGLYEIAQKQDVRVILDGFDGDSTVSHGTGYLRDLAKQGKWVALFYELKGYSRNFEQPFWQMQRNFVVNYGINPVIDKYKPLKFGRRLWRSLLRRTKISADKPVTSWRTSLNSDFIRKIDLEQRRRNQRKSLIDSQIHQRAEHHYSLVRGVMPDVLEVLDKAAAAYSIELRFPFWDKRLIEFCLSLPPEQKIRQGWTRMIMRRGLKDILPPEIEWRGGKSNLGPSFSHGLSTFEGQRFESMSDRNFKEVSSYTDLTNLKTAYQRFDSKKANTEDLKDIWKAFNLSLWLENFERPIDSCESEQKI